MPRGVSELRAVRKELEEERQDCMKFLDERNSLQDTVDELNARIAVLQKHCATLERRQQELEQRLCAPVFTITPRFETW